MRRRPPPAKRFAPSAAPAAAPGARSCVAIGGKPQRPRERRAEAAQIAKCPAAFRRYYTAMRSELTRGVGPWAATAVNVANMIGTGVFLKTRVMTCNVGSAKTVLVVWLAAGLLSLAGTFSYSEIAAMMPEAGGDYVYLRRAYGRLVGFLYGWISFTVARAGSQAALAVGLAIFMNVALGGALDHWHLELGPAGIGGLSLVALAAIWTVALVNCASVSAGGRVALILTIAKVF